MGLGYLTQVVLGVLKIFRSGVQMTPREALDFKGAGVSVVDNPSTGRTDVTIAGVGAATYTAPLQSTGGATPTVSIDAATTGARGTMSAADKTKLDGIGATSNVAAVTAGTGILVTGSAGAGTAPSRAVAADLTYLATSDHAGYMGTQHVADLQAATAALVFVDAELELPLVVDENKVIEIAPASGDLVIPVDDSGHIDGCVAIIRIPAGNADSITFADNLHVEGDVLDPAEDYEVRIQYSDGQFISRAVSLPVIESAAPLVLSAAVYEADPDKLIVTFDHEMYSTGLLGLSLDFSVGTARTITGLDSGLGTVELTYDLSGDIDGADEFDLVIASPNNLISMNGVAKAAQTIAVTNEVTPALTGVIADWDWNVTASTTESGGAQSAQADQSGNGNTLAQATSGKRPTYTASDATLGNQPTVHFERSDGDCMANTALQHEGGALTDKASYSIAMIIKRPLTAQQIYCEVTTSAGTLFDGLIIFSSGTTDVRADASTTTYSSYATTDWHSLIVTWNGATGDRKIYIDGSLVVTGNAAFNPGTLAKFTLGWSVGELATYASDADFNRVTFFDHVIAPGDDNFDIWEAEAQARIAL